MKPTAQLRFVLNQDPQMPAVLQQWWERIEQGDDGPLTIGEWRDVPFVLN